MVVFYSLDIELKKQTLGEISCIANKTLTVLQKCEFLSSAWDHYLGFKSGVSNSDGNVNMYGKGNTNISLLCSKQPKKISEITLQDLRMFNIAWSYRCTLSSETIFDYWKPFKNDEKCFLFHLKSSFRSQDI